MLWREREWKCDGISITNSEGRNNSEMTKSDSEPWVNNRMWKLYLKISKLSEI